MSRFVAQDFNHLQSYLRDYAVAPNLGADAREILLKRMHKHCLAALQVWAIADGLAKSGELTVCGNVVAEGSDHFLQLGESFSDLVSAMFASIHGLYKPAYMSLRSSIETMVRGLAGITSAEAASTTSLYRLFEVAEIQPPFAGTATKYFNSLYQDYRALCQHTHSGSPAHMARNYALANIPKHNSTELRKVVGYFEKIVKSILALLIQSHPNLYLRAPHQSRDLLDDIVPASIRIRVLGG